VVDQLVSPYTTINGLYYMTLLHDMVWPALSCKRPKLLEKDIIFIRGSAAPNCHHDLQSLLQARGWEMLALPFDSTDLFPGDYFL
jgi:hypothetical protein